MGLNLIVKAESIEAIERPFGEAGEQIEIFPIAEGEFGVSIPAKVFDSFTEDHIRRSLTAFDYFDLYEGEWRKGMGGAYPS